jgi:hypothetical protein
MQRRRELRMVTAPPDHRNDRRDEGVFAAASLAAFRLAASDNASGGRVRRPTGGESVDTKQQMLRWAPFPEERRPRLL